MLVLLLQQVGEGDELAFRQLYDQTCGRVERVAGRTVRSPQHTAEIVQEVFLHVWQHAGAFDPARGSVLGWLSMLTHRRAVDRVRHVARSIERDHDVATAADLPVADVAVDALARLDAAELRLAVDRLPVRQRDAVLLTFFGGYTQQQAAAALSVPLGTLKSRVHSAVGSLRRHYVLTGDDRSAA